MCLNPELVFYSGSTLLEGPCWDAMENVIYCVSIDQCLIYCINPEMGEVKSFRTNGSVGCVVIEESGMLLSAEKSGIHRINPKTGERTFLVQLEGNPAMRYNDGKLDPRGRFLVGTKGDAEDLPGRGRLFSYDGKQARTLVAGTTISNGIGFSNAGDILYFIDTPTKKVGRYEYNLETGEAVFDRHVVEVEGDVWPDGMCVDVDDMIWVAEWGGGRVCNWNPETGEKLREIKLPCSNTSSCCLGGDDLRDLYVTTAKVAEMDEPMAGGLFRIPIRS
jgi:sugar lactone lactonase YvrE